MDRNDLIEWLEEYDAMLPPHIKVAMTHSQPIEKQKTHILRHVYDYGIYFLNKS